MVAVEVKTTTQEPTCAVLVTSDGRGSLILDAVEVKTTTQEPMYAVLVTSDGRGSLILHAVEPRTTTQEPTVAATELSVGTDVNMSLYFTISVPFRHLKIMTCYQSDIHLQSLCQMTLSAKAIFVS